LADGGECGKKHEEALHEAGKGESVERAVEDGVVTAEVTSTASDEGGGRSEGAVRTRIAQKSRAVKRERREARTALDHDQSERLRQASRSRGAHSAMPCQKPALPSRYASRLLVQSQR